MPLFQIKDLYNKNQLSFAADIIRNRNNELVTLISNKEAKNQLFHVRKEIERVSLMYLKYKEDYNHFSSPDNKDKNEREDYLNYFKKDVLDIFDNYLMYLNRIFDDLVNEANNKQTITDEIKILNDFNKKMKNKEFPVLYYNETSLYWSGSNQSFVDLIIYFKNEKSKKYNDIISDDFLKNLHKYINIKNEKKYSLSVEKTRASSKNNFEKKILNLYTQETLNHYYTQIKHYIENYM